MDLNGACSLEDLDPITSADIEVALYGMLHHIYEEVKVCNMSTGASSNPEIQSENSNLSYVTKSDSTNSDSCDILDSTLLTLINPTEGNPCGETSNWKKYCSTKWTPEMIEFYEERDQGPFLDTILKSNPDNIQWYLDEEDRRRKDVPRLSKNFQKNRYFGKIAKKRCFNCNQWGHEVKSCQDPIKLRACSICGMPGHSCDKCPNQMCLGVC